MAFNIELANNIRPRYMSRKYTYSTLPKPMVMDDYGLGELGELGGWFKRVKKAVKLAVKKPLKIVEVATLSPTLFMKRKETRGRVLRRVGGAITGAATGFVTGGPIGAVVGAGTGATMAKKGTKGIKGYGKIGLVSGAAGGAASFITGYSAGALAKTGYLSSNAAAKATLAAGKAGMTGFNLAVPAQSLTLQAGTQGTVGLLSTGSKLSTIGKVVTGAKTLTDIIAPRSTPTAEPSGPSAEFNNYYQSPTGDTYPISAEGNVQTSQGMFPIGDLVPPKPSQPSLTMPGWRPQAGVPTEFEPWSREGAYETSVARNPREMEFTEEALPFGLTKTQLLLLVGGIGALAIVATGKRK
jgi:hypothetical protein